MKWINGKDTKWSPVNMLGRVHRLYVGVRRHPRHGVELSEGIIYKWRPADKYWKLKFNHWEVNEWEHEPRMRFEKLAQAKRYAEVMIKMGETEQKE